MEILKERRKWISGAIFVIIIICCALPIFLLAYDSFLHSLWINLISPHPRHVKVSEPHLVAKDLDAFMFKWSEDGSTISVYESNWTSSTPDAPNTVKIFDSQTGILVNTHEADSTVQKDFYTCPTKNIAIELKHINETRSLFLLKDNEQIREFAFSSVYNNDLGGSRMHNQASFSTECNYFAFTISGWIYYEGEGPEELWLLDIQNETLLPIVIGRWPILRLWDYPVQSVQPAWSPDEEEIVFGDSYFGLEIYDIGTGNRRWLAGSGTAGWNPKWSYDGSWIAAARDYSILLISPDGKRMAMTGECSFIGSDMEWSPVDNQLAYLCHQAKEKGYGDSLWIWTID